MCGSIPLLFGKYIVGLRKAGNASGHKTAVSLLGLLSLGLCQSPQSPVRLRSVIPKALAPKFCRFTIGGLSSQQSQVGSVCIASHQSLVGLIHRFVSKVHRFAIHAIHPAITSKRALLALQNAPGMSTFSKKNFSAPSYTFDVFFAHWTLSTKKICFWQVRRGR